MKAQSIGNNNERGSGILEIIIAVAILTLSISAATLLSFANQTLKTDSDTSGEALYKAKEALEKARADSHIDFMGVVSTGATTTDIYTKKLDVVNITPCRKEVTSTITWSAEKTRPQNIKLATDLADIAGILALGGDCASEPPKSLWHTPANFNSTDFSPAGTPASGIDVQNRIAFMTALPSASSTEDFYVFDARYASATSSPVLFGKLDISPDGMNDIDAALYPDGYYYAFIANNKKTVPYDQLQVVRTPKNLSGPPVFMGGDSRSLPGVSGSCPNFCPQGRTIYYLAPSVYVGTHRTGGDEFHIYNIATSSDPNPQWKGSIELNHNINSIAVRDQFVSGVKKRIAYLATSGNTKDIFVLDVSVPTAPVVLASLDAGGSEDAQVLWITGNYLYLGKDKGSGPDLFIFDTTNPSSPVPVNSIDIAMKNGSAIRGIRVVGNFAFIGTTDSTDPFQVWNIADLANIYRQDTTVFNFSQKTIAMDYEADRIYTANESNDALRIIYSP